MSSQDQSASASASFKLNPTATEFVPGNFNFSPSAASTASASADTSKSNNNYSSNNGYQNQRYNNNNQYGQNNRYNNNRNHHSHNNYYQHNNQLQGNEFDPIEIEARCEAVVEILQDDKIRDQLNHISNNQSAQPDQNSRNSSSNTSRQNSRSQNGHHDEEPEPQFDDEEEMLEMLEMQEECRLEMMKFYIQSQNPSLFEEIYHDVSYPDAKKPPSPTRQPAPKATVVAVAEPVKAEPSASAADTASADSVKDLIAANLNPDVDDFVPNKLADLSLTDDKK